MADFVFTSACGAVAEKVTDSPNVLGILLITTAESDATMRDRATVAAVVANSTESAFTNYARKTALAGTVTIDTANNRAKVTLSANPVTWVAAGGAVNETLAKLIVFLDEGGTDATRIPLVGLDCVITTTGNTLTVTFDADGFARATAV
jgi:hypothetical protein